MTQTLLTAVLISPVMLAILPVKGTAGDGAELAAVLRKAGAWESYAFTIEEKPGPGTGGAVEARYQKGKPLACKADRLEFFRRGDALVYREGGRWLRSRTGRTSDPLRVLGAVAKVRAVRLPHEEVAALAKAVGAVKKEQDGKPTIYKADLDTKAARSLARPEHRGVAQGGSVRFWVGAGGKLLKYTMAIKLQGRIGSADVDGSVVKTVTLSGVEATRVTIPEAARKALE